MKTKCRSGRFLFFCFCFDQQVLFEVYSLGKNKLHVQHAQGETLMQERKLRSARRTLLYASLGAACTIYLFITQINLSPDQQVLFEGPRARQGGEQK